MIKRFVLYLFVLNMLLITSGCVESMKRIDPFKNAQVKEDVVELPERIIVNRKDLPGDVEHVMAAMINAIRGGDKNIPNVNFDPNGKHEFMEDLFSYKRFDVKFIDIIYFKTEKALDHVRYSLLEFGLYFSDAIGRSAYVRVMADYVVAKNDIFITTTEYEILPNPYPEIQAFILPREVVTNASPEVKNDYTSLFLLAQQKAVTMEPTKGERIQREQYDQLSFIGRMKYKSDSIPKSYCVLVFCKERLRPESRFVMTVSKDEKVSNNTLSNPYYLNDDGWTVGIVGGKFALDAYDKEVFFHVQFNPGIDPANTELKYISRFSSVKNYDTQDKKPLNPYLKAFKKQKFDTATVVSDNPGVSNGSFSSGMVFLNPAVAKDAKIIQKRLSELGFYTMKIDGAFGKGSQRSLMAFKKTNGLAKNSVWNLKTQKALFKGSGL
ncbi:MAG: peptidoglycan-binding protein [Desulfobacula sp.]|nr:peptidoglycan-binding protein [Desulfobacula sp.]